MGEREICGLVTNPLRWQQLVKILDIKNPDWPFGASNGVSGAMLWERWKDSIPLNVFIHVFDGNTEDSLTDSTDDRDSKIFNSVDSRIRMQYYFNRF